MDLNRLYREHQSALLKADEAISFAANALHLERAAELASTIGQIQQRMGAAAAASWTALAAKARPADHRPGHREPGSLNAAGTAS